MAFCNPKEELNTLLCDIPSIWRDAIVKALSCVLSLKRTISCDGVKQCETLTQLLPVEKVGNTITFKYKDEKGVTNVRSIDLTTVIGKSLEGLDPKCLMSQEAWDALTYTQRLQAIFSKTCCVYTSCCDCDDCTDCQHTCICTSYLVSGTAPYTISYKDCDTKLLTEVNVVTDDYQFCALKGSIILPDGVIFTEISVCGETTTSTTSSTTTTTAGETTTTSSTSTTTTTTEATTTTTSTSTTTTTTEATTTTTTTTTTTSTSTTTTTTIAPTFFYIADEYSCTTCTLTQTDVLVELPSSVMIDVLNYYLPSVGHDGFIYRVTNGTPQPGGSAIQLIETSFSTCGGGCI